jgi:Rrf2 family protein
MLSNSCRYGIRAVIYLASQPSSNGKTGIRQISKELGLPSPYLAKILQELAKQKILSSSKGPHGGFALLKDARRITLIDIVKAIDGDEFFTNCIMHSGKCGGKKNNKKHCPLHDDYESTRQDLIKLFSMRTIHDLAGTSSNKDMITI